MQRARMFLTAAAVWAALAGLAAAQPETAPAPARGSIGLGAAAMLTMPVGIQFVYDPGAWHLDVIASLRHDGDSDIAAGTRFFYHLHRAQAADFSIGGGFGFQSLANDNNIAHIELSAQIRAFIVSNVALGGTLGLGILAIDSSTVVLTGQPTGALAVTYFF